MSDESLLHLFNGNVSVLRIPNFYPVELGAQLAHWLENHPNRKIYYHEIPNKDHPNELEYLYYHVDRVGFPRNRLINKLTDHPDWQAYFEQRDQIMAEIRQVTNNQHPIDQLIDQLQIHWSNGAELESIDGQQLFAGIGRITVAGTKTLLADLPHVDGLWDYKSHFAANIYLRMPDIGGELEVWKLPTLTSDEIKNLNPDLNWREMGHPSQVIKPEEGDLIIFNTRRPHAVLGYERGSRVTIASFIGYDPGKPLKLYS